MSDLREDAAWAEVGASGFWDHPALDVFGGRGVFALALEVLLRVARAAAQAVHSAAQLAAWEADAGFHSDAGFRYRYRYGYKHSYRNWFDWWSDHDNRNYCFSECYKQLNSGQHFRRLSRTYS